MVYIAFSTRDRGRDPRPSERGFFSIPIKAVFRGQVPDKMRMDSLLLNLQDAC